MTQSYLSKVQLICENIIFVPWLPKIHLGMVSLFQFRLLSQSLTIYKLVWSVIFNPILGERGSWCLLLLLLFLLVDFGGGGEEKRSGK